MRLGCAAFAASVSFEAESGAPGTDFTNGADGVVQYISISTDKTNFSNPERSNCATDNTVTFPAAGRRQLYARVRVDPDTLNDDSMFYASSFGTKSPTTDADWITVNGLGGAGCNSGTDVVTGGVLLTRLKANMEFEIRHSSYCLIFEN